MNWSLFFATITWSLTAVSVITGFIAMCMLDPDMRWSVRRCLRIFGVALAVFTLCVALIAGMGWHPHK